MAEYNKIISTVNSITQDLTIIPDSTDVMVIDTSNNRIGINTINPEYSIHVKDNISQNISGIISTDYLKVDKKVLTDLLPDTSNLDIGSLEKQWNSIFVKNLVNHSLSTTSVIASDVTIRGNTLSVIDNNENKIKTLGFSSVHNKVDLRPEIYAHKTLDVSGINIRDANKLTFDGSNQTIKIPHNIDISKNTLDASSIIVKNSLDASSIIVKNSLDSSSISVRNRLDASYISVENLFINNDSEFAGNITIGSNLIIIDKNDLNRVVINLLSDQQFKINGKLLVTGEIENAYLFGLINRQNSSILLNNSVVLNKTHFYTLYSSSSLLEASLDINIENDINFDNYNSLLENPLSGFKDDYNNYNGYNIFFTNKSYDDIKLLSNDHKHLSYYNMFDFSSNSFSTIYNRGSEEIYPIDNNRIIVMEPNNNYIININFTMNISFIKKIIGSNYYIDLALMKFYQNNKNNYIPYNIVRQEKIDINLNSNVNVINFEFVLENQVIQSNSCYGLGFLVYVQDSIYNGDISGINKYYDRQYFIDNKNSLSTIYNKTNHSFWKNQIGFSTFQHTKSWNADYNRSDPNRRIFRLFSKYLGKSELGSYQSDRGYIKTDNAYHYFGMNVLFQYTRTSPEPAWDNKVNFKWFDLVALRSDGLFTNQQISSNSINTGPDYKIVVNKSGRYLLSVGLNGRWHWYAGVYPTPPVQHPETISTYDRHSSMNIAILKNVDSNIELVVDTEGDELYYSAIGGKTSSYHGGGGTDYCTFHFNKKCFIDLSENDSISLGMLHRLRGRFSVSGNRINDHGYNFNDPNMIMASSTSHTVTVPYNVPMVYNMSIEYDAYTTYDNHFSLIRIDQDIDLDIEIPINGISYQIKTPDSQDFKDINIENSLNLNQKAIFKAANIDFSGISNNPEDISSGYLYKDAGNFIKIKP